VARGSAAGRAAASKRQLESSVDWHAALLDQFDNACIDVRHGRHGLVRRLATGQAVIVHSNATAAAAAAAATNASQSTAASAAATRYTGDE